MKKRHSEETRVLFFPILKNSFRHHHLQSIKGKKILHIFLRRKSIILGGQKLLRGVFRSSFYYIKLLFGG